MAWIGGTAVVRRRQRFLRARVRNGQTFGRAPFQCMAAHAVVAGACLPHAISSDVGAVHHDMSLEAHDH